jgi:hypothetical protein
MTALEITFLVAACLAWLWVCIATTWALWNIKRNNKRRLDAQILSKLKISTEFIEDYKLLHAELTRTKKRLQEAHEEYDEQVDLYVTALNDLHKLREKNSESAQLLDIIGRSIDIYRADQEGTEGDEDWEEDCNNWFVEDEEEDDFWTYVHELDADDCDGCCDECEDVDCGEENAREFSDDGFPIPPQAKFSEEDNGA